MAVLTAAWRSLQVKLTAVALLLDHKLDESYTPSKISVRAGTNHSDLKEIHLETLSTPQGWKHIPLQLPVAQCVGLPVLML